MRKIKILLTNLSYLNHNYGAQGIVFPFVDKLNRYLDAEYTFILHKISPADKEFLANNGFLGVTKPPLRLMMANYNQFLNILYVFFALPKKGRNKLAKLRKDYSKFSEVIKNQDVLIDLSGIEFVGNTSFRRRYSNYLNAVSFQALAKKYKKPYFKYTKSYGPFPVDPIYRFLVKKSLKNLPFLFVRGKDNLKEVKKLNLKIPLHSFPDVSLSLKPESKKWALNYIANLGMNPEKKNVGLSLSAVVASIKADNDSSCGENHLKLCEEIIDFCKKENNQIILLPHSMGDGTDVNSCDLALTRNFYNKLTDKENVFLIDDIDLTYRQARAIVGLMDFYITGRYHSVASALFMGIPVICLSWHIKYKDIMSLFLDKSPIINCREVTVKNALRMIKKYYYNREWFDKDEIVKKRGRVNQEIDKSIKLIANEIEKIY